MTKPNRKQFNQSMATVASLAKTTERQLNLIERLFAALAGRQPPASPAESGPAQPLGQSDSTQPEGGIQDLTPREIEVARLICQGFTSEVIADRLVTSVSTIKKHRSHIRGKIGVSEREGLEAMRETWDVG